MTDDRAVIASIMDRLYEPPAVEEAEECERCHESECVCAYCSCGQYLKPDYPHDVCPACIAEEENRNAILEDALSGRR